MSIQYELRSIDGRDTIRCENDFDWKLGQIIETPSGKKFSVVRRSELAVNIQESKFERQRNERLEAQRDRRDADRFSGANEFRGRDTSELNRRRERNIEAEILKALEAKGYDERSNDVVLQKRVTISASLDLKRNPPIFTFEPDEIVVAVQREDKTILRQRDQRFGIRGSDWKWGESKNVLVFGDECREYSLIVTLLKRRPKVIDLEISFREIMARGATTETQIAEYWRERLTSAGVPFAFVVNKSLPTILQPLRGKLSYFEHLTGRKLVFRWEDGAEPGTLEKQSPLNEPDPEAVRLREFRRKMQLLERPDLQVDLESLRKLQAEQAERIAREAEEREVQRKLAEQNEKRRRVAAALGVSVETVDDDMIAKLSGVAKAKETAPTPAEPLDLSGDRAIDFDL